VTDQQRQLEHVLEATADIARILREVLEHLAAIDQRLARIEGRILPPGTN
jgi:hypothetical protein